MTGPKSLSELVGRWVPGRIGIWLVQLPIFIVSGALAFLLRFEFAIPSHQIVNLKLSIFIWIVCKTLVFYGFRLDRGWWRHVSVPDLKRVAIGCVVSSTISCAGIACIAPTFPRSVYILDFLICFHLTASVRVIVRLLGDAAINAARSPRRKRALIYGAGAGGIMLLHEIRNNPKLAYDILGFVDDDVTKHGMQIQQVTILGSGGDLDQLCKVKQIEEVLVAIPSARGNQMSAILQLCSKANVTCKTVAGFAEVMAGTCFLDRMRVDRIRNIAVEDLLGRSPVRLDHAEISAKLSGRSVLVTGAAGSIGSELCRQIAPFRPASIVGFEIAETALFHIEQEMVRTYPDVPFYAEVGSVQNPRRLAEVFERHSPSIVYHAAAYKHVPLMETHAFEAVENNILGTLNVAVAAGISGVDDFVMISSDKAVCPTNVMGATKRAAELVIRSLQNGGVKYVSVRFGNVLGSNGSVVPTFKEQIARGGPVTVTHPEMQRYFMTIPEACQLVIQASTMGNGGEIFILDMGDPIKILDLARNLILLSGLRPNEDVRIEFTGIRPGEKLYEEINLSDESLLPTRHEKIKIFAGHALDGDAIGSYLESLRDICARRDLHDLVVLLKEMVPEYSPSTDLLRRTFSSEFTSQT